MLLPTPEEIATAKVEAAKKTGRDEVLLVQLTAPVDAAFLVAPLTRRSWADIVDEQNRDFVTSHKSAVLSHLVWPAAATALDIFRRRAVAPRKIAEHLQRRAGKLPGDPVVKLLAEVVETAPVGAPGSYEVAPGLSLDKARALLSEAPSDGGEPRELWAAWGPHPRLSLVMATPDPDQYLAAEAANLRAVERRERIYEARLDFALPAIVWSREPVEALLEDLPALGADIKTAYITIGGEGAEASSKSL
jgi:hypothetical protein